jgi:hypothetical protein
MNRGRWLATSAASAVGGNKPRLIGLGRGLQIDNELELIGWPRDDA